MRRKKEFTRLRDQLSRERRELPWVKVDKDYLFDGPRGKETLAQLFWFPRDRTKIPRIPASLGPVPRPIQALRFNPWKGLALGMRADLGSEADVLEGKSKCVSTSGHNFALYRVEGQVYCLDNRCTHLGGPLCRGTLAGFVVQCPWHGSRFDVRSGQVVGPPARTQVKAYPVRIEGGHVWADVE